MLVAGRASIDRCCSRFFQELRFRLRVDASLDRLPHHPAAVSTMDPLTQIRSTATYDNNNCLDPPRPPLSLPLTCILNHRLSLHLTLLESRTLQLTWSST